MRPLAPRTLVFSCTSALRVVRPLLFDYTSPGGPVAVAAFLPQSQLLNGALPPGAHPAARFLPPGQRFDITLRLVRTCARQRAWQEEENRTHPRFPHAITHSVRLCPCAPRHVTQELPESPVNEGVGVFQVRGALLTSGGEARAAGGVASVPAALRYRSPLVRWARAATRAPLHALGWAAETQTLQLQLFTGASMHPRALHERHKHLTRAHFPHLSQNSVSRAARGAVCRAARGAAAARGRRRCCRGAAGVRR
jgi:hypothetical protein